MEALWTQESRIMQIIEMDRTVTLAEQLARAPTGWDGAAR
jgi:hypothetical protein